MQKDRALKMTDVDTTRPLAICVMGPTAVGKTALACLLAEHLPVEIVSVDASQVYRGLDIGTAKPSLEERTRFPHRLIDIRDPADSYSAEAFRQDALREMAGIVAAGRVPLLVGGTMFYFRALEFGFSDLPSADPSVREQLRAEAARIGWAALHARLAARDPRSAARINPNDTQRIQRALEILALTGESLSERSVREGHPAAPYRFLKLALLPPDRHVLHERIENRFSRMLNEGLVEEVRGLQARTDLGLHLPSVRTVGYRQIWEYLTKTINYNEMVTRSVAASRQLAKRQMTWLRSYPEVITIETGEEPQIERALTALRNDAPAARKLGL